MWSDHGDKPMPNPNHILGLNIFVVPVLPCKIGFHP